MAFQNCYALAGIIYLIDNRQALIKGTVKVLIIQSVSKYRCKLNSLSYHGEQDLDRNVGVRSENVNCDR